jgi:hypothetical protein
MNCRGEIISEWEPVELHGEDYAVFLVHRACVDCGAEWKAHERISLRHPGGDGAAMIDRDKTAAEFHVRGPALM